MYFSLKLAMVKQEVQRKKDELSTLQINNRMKEATKQLLQRECKSMRKQLEERARQGLQNLHLDNGK